MRSPLHWSPCFSRIRIKSSWMNCIHLSMVRVDVKGYGQFGCLCAVQMETTMRTKMNVYNTCSKAYLSGLVYFTYSVITRLGWFFYNALRSVARLCGIQHHARSFFRLSLRIWLEQREWSISVWPQSYLLPDLLPWNATIGLQCKAKCLLIFVFDECCLLSVSMALPFLWIAFCLLSFALQLYQSEWLVISR